MITREEWLTFVARSLWDSYIIHEKGEDEPPAPVIRVACGWPLNRKRLAECYRCGEEEEYEIFISPLVPTGLSAAGFILHELAHIAVGFEAGHGKKFVDYCRTIGLTEGKPTWLTPGPELKTRIKNYLEALPPYPYGGIREIQHID